ncbi:MAG: type IV pili methyl-accepting chemotaxis transducer N-terminal domain-containing protein [Nitrosomonadales bacterium]|nr:type IV pili methyl-accepting chemotaxis transducer N-terminal domain-containing protein [Nitrosomonadales bacterium]
MASKLTLPKFDLSALAANVKLPLIGKLPITQRLIVLGALALLCSVIAGSFVYINNREAVYITAYATESGKLRMLPQRLAKQVLLSQQGNAIAFDDLTRSRQDYARVIQKLDKGDNDLPATSGAAREVMNKLIAGASKMALDVKTVEDSRAEFVMAGNAIGVIEAESGEFRKLSQQMIDGSSGEQKAAAIRLALSMERIVRDSTRMLVNDVTTEQLTQLEAYALAAKNDLAVLPAADPNVQALAKIIESYRNSIGVLATQSPKLAKAKIAARAVLSTSDTLMRDAQVLVDVYLGSTAARFSSTVAPVAAGFVLLLLLLISKEYIGEIHRRAELVEYTNSRNQSAILRLMNELGDLADGDLTVRATVSEDITGAIADSLNYTTEEFRKLVARITAAAEQMGQATKDAEAISSGLLEATQTQAREIQGAGEAVQLMAKSIKEVDSSAAQSADVARRTLAATEQGARAVRNTISGMDDIREQIQETSKRIKRLGESSQEIGEIVDLISDITEQTNVLALNAAIQAASAGEAGRGFSVVAEEVQRLAERSAEATKQIGALVKTIQGDTHDAVAAMEKSTLGVVEGAKLSDEAGQSLREIEQVSNELATLINSISTSTQVQADMAGEVAKGMQDILKITVQTTEGTRLTANSIAQLTNLASDLRGSVAGFKL